MRMAFVWRTPSDALLQVEHQLCLLCICTEGIALESGTLGGSELYPYVRLLQFYGKVSANPNAYGSA